MLSTPTSPPSHADVSVLPTDTHHHHHQYAHYSQYAQYYGTTRVGYEECGDTQDPFISYAQALHAYTLALWTESRRLAEEKARNRTMTEAAKKTKKPSSSQQKQQSPSYRPSHQHQQHQQHQQLSVPHQTPPHSQTQIGAHSRSTLSITGENPPPPPPEDRSSSTEPPTSWIPSETAGSGL